MQNKINLGERLFSLKMAPGSDLNGHIAEMTDIVEQYRSSGEAFSDAAAARRLIGSLPESFNAIKAALLVRVDTFGQAVESVKEYSDMAIKSGPSQENEGALRFQQKGRGKPRVFRG